MSEIKIIGYILIAVLFLSAITMAFVEMFFAYRERLMLGDALYNSCRVAAEYGYNYLHMRDMDAELYEKDFFEAFTKTFAAAFDLTFMHMAGDTAYFKSNNATYNDFEVELDFMEREITDASGEKRMTVEVIAEATSPYKFKHSYILQMINDGSDIETYELKSRRDYVMVVTN